MTISTEISKMFFTKTTNPAFYMKKCSSIRNAYQFEKWMFIIRPLSKKQSVLTGRFAAAAPHGPAPGRFIMSSGVTGAKWIPHILLTPVRWRAPLRHVHGWWTTYCRRIVKPFFVFVSTADCCQGVTHYSKTPTIMMSKRSKPAATHMIRPRSFCQKETNAWNIL